VSQRFTTQEWNFGLIKRCNATRHVATRFTVHNEHNMWQHDAICCVVMRRLTFMNRA